MWRLIYQGSELHQTGRLPVLLDPDLATFCRGFGDAVAAGNLQMAAVTLRGAEEAFDRPGMLPERPDEAAVEAWLHDVRRAYWEGS